MTATDAFLSFLDHLKETVQDFDTLPAGFKECPVLVFEEYPPSEDKPFLRVHQLDSVPLRQGGWYGTLLVQVDVIYPKAKGVPASLLCSQMIDQIKRAYDSDKIGKLTKYKYEAGLNLRPVGSYTPKLTSIVKNREKTPSPAIAHLTFEIVTNL